MLMYELCGSWGKILNCAFLLYVIPRDSREPAIHFLRFYKFGTSGRGKTITLPSYSVQCDCGGKFTTFSSTNNLLFISYDHQQEPWHIYDRNVLNRTKLPNIFAEVIQGHISVWWFYNHNDSERGTIFSTSGSSSISLITSKPVSDQRMV